MEKGSCSIQETVRRLRNGFLTEEQFLDLFIRRINRVNPHVRALTESFPSATSDVRKNQPSLRIRAPGEQPLLGIPIVVNCDIPTRAGHTTTGSLALDFRPEKDARLVQRLADAGGVIVGKANITEWGNHRDREAGHGWSAMGGQTLGAHHVNQDPSGSSSGAAVAVALELCMAAIGTSGGIILPAERNGVVGIKPTKGLVSSDLVLTSTHFGTPGVMASTVKDAAFVLSAIADTTAENGLQDFASACDAGALRGKRIGVPTDYINLCLKGEIDPSHHTILDRFKRAWGTLKNKGVDLVDNIELPGFGSTEAIKEARGMARLVWICDLREDIEQYLAACGEQVDSNTFAKILEQTKEDANEDYIERGAEWLELSEGGPGLRAQLQYQNIIEKLQRLDTEQGVTAALRRYDLDAIVMPSMITSTVASYGGLPVITVPHSVYPPGSEINSRQSGSRDLIWQAPGIPFGISFIGAAGSDHDLMGIAFAYEHKQGGRHATVLPHFVPHD